MTRKRKPCDEIVREGALSSCWLLSALSPGLIPAASASHFALVAASASHFALVGTYRSRERECTADRALSNRASERFAPTTKRADQRDTETLFFCSDTTTLLFALLYLSSQTVDRENAVKVPPRPALVAQELRRGAFEAEATGCFALVRR